MSNAGYIPLTTGLKPIETSEYARPISYLQVGSPCVADHPAQNFPLAVLPDYMLLLGSLKDQEENLIVVKRGHREEKKKRRHTKISAKVPVSGLKHKLQSNRKTTSREWLQPVYTILGLCISVCELYTEKHKTVPPQMIKL